MTDEHTPLCECDITDLLDEIGRRTTSSVLVYLAPIRGKVNEGDDYWQAQWRGGKITAVGLMETAVTAFKKDLAVNMEESPLVEDVTEETSNDDDEVDDDAAPA